MSVPQQTELETLHERIAALERENAALQARTNELISRAQEKTYWLDRWNLDLNALMRRRGAAEFRAGVRGVRAVARFVQARLVKPLRRVLRG